MKFIPHCQSCQSRGTIALMYTMYLERQKRRYLGTRSARIKSMSIVAFASFSFYIRSLCVSILFAWYAKDLPRPDKVQRKDGLST